MKTQATYEALLAENENLRHQLDEATDTIEAIRSGQVDALIVKGKDGNKLYTLKTADQTYRVFIEKMTEGAVTLNSNGIILYSNTRFAQMVNRPLSKVLGVAFLEFIAPADKQAFETLIAKAWQHDCKGELQLIGNNNQLIPFQLSLTTLELDEGFSMSVILTDLTAQKQTQLQLKINNQKLEASNLALETSNNDLQQFASVASHDLQEPLRKIMIFSSLIKQNHLNELSPETRNYLEKIIFSSGRMKDLIVDILNFSRLSQDNDSFTKIELYALINDLLQDFDLKIKEKDARIIIEDLPVIEGNKGQLRQVFQNLISNSLKFCKPNVKPEIVIKQVYDNGDFAKVFNAGNAVFISLKDNGIGFNQKYHNDIFTIFQRLHTKDKFEGTGIGLAITKKIIDKHRGFIKAYSKENDGAEFIIALPALQINTNVEKEIVTG